MTTLKQFALILLAGVAFACAYYMVYNFPVWAQGTAMLGALGCCIAGIIAIIQCATVGSATR